MVSDEKIIEWAKKNYGEGWAKNIELAKLLYKRAHSKTNVYEVKNTTNEVEKFSDIKESGNYTIEVIVLNLRKSKYIGCPLCKRKFDKGCIHISNGTEPKEILMMPIEVTDKYGDIKELVSFVVEGNEYKEFNIGDMIKLELYVKVVNNEVKLYLNNYEVVKRKEIDEYEVYEEVEKIIENNDIKDILEVLHSVKSLSRAPFLEMITRKGISIDDIEQYVIFDEITKTYALSEKGEKMLKG